MTTLLSCLSPEIVRDLGWTLIHFLWQGVLLAVLLNAILPLCRGAVARHNWALATLAMMTMAPIVTFLFVHDFGSGNEAAAQTVNAAAGGPATVSAALPWIDWLVVFWLAGIAVLSLRAAGGWYLARSLARRGTLAVPPDLLKRCHDLQRRLAVTGPVRFLLSRRINVPVVIGWLRPVVLIPVSALAGLSPQQLDALILHELAHIRRLDTVINVMLVAVEIILFYHPAVWWVSRRVRIEREHCCDDVAVGACGDAAVYVEALTSLEAWKGTAGLALAANGGGLKTRVARLLDGPADKRRFPLSAITGLAFIGLVAGSLAMAQTGMQTDPHFAICVVDESVDSNALSGPPGDMRVPMIQNGKRHYVWVKREGRITDDMISEARAGTSSDGQQVIDIRLSPEGQKRFAALTRARVGHRIAMIVNGTVLTDSKVVEPILGPNLQINGFDSEKDARMAAAQITAAARLAPSPSTGQNAYRPNDAGYPSDDKNPVMLRPTPGTHTLVPYPKQSQRLKEQGTVRLTVMIGRDGVVSRVAVEKSSGHPRLDAAAAQHVKSNWSWLPPIRNGRPVTATTKITVVFNLKNAEPGFPARPPGQPRR